MASFDPRPQVPFADFPCDSKWPRRCGLKWTHFVPEERAYYCDECDDRGRPARFAEPFPMNG